MLIITRVERRTAVEPACGDKPKNASLSLGSLAIAFALSFGLAMGTLAAEVVPPSSDAASISREHESVPQPKSSIAPIELPEGSEPQSGDAGIVVKLRSVVIEEAHAVRPQQLVGLYTPLLNKDVSLAQLYSLAQAVAKLYRDKGFILAQAYIPGGQSLDPNAADVKIRVIEGYIDQIKYADPSYASGSKGALIRSYLSKIPTSCYHSGAPPANGHCPLHKDVLERYLLLARDLGGVDVETVLVPGEQPGSASLYVTIKEKLLDAFANVNNRGTRYLGPVQPSAGFALHDLTGLYDTLDAQYQTAIPVRELQYGQVSFNVPVGSEGLTIGVGGNYADSKPESVLSSLDLDSRIYSASITASYPLYRTRASNWTLVGSFTGRNYDTDSKGSLLNEDRVRFFTVGVTHDFADGLLGGAINLFDVRASRGINGLGSSNPDSTLLSRQGAALDFSKVNVTLSRLQQLASTSVSLLIEATGQFAADRMVVSEQFGFGGERFGRAYDPSELLGDSGAAVRGELQFTPVSSSSSITGLQLYLFSDYGYIWNRPECGCGSPEASQASASSAGGGVRTNVTSHISGYLEAAEPLNRIVQAQGNKNPRVFASITVRY